MLLPKRLLTSIALTLPAICSAYSFGFPSTTGFQTQTRIYSSRGIIRDPHGRQPAGASPLASISPAAAATDSRKEPEAPRKRSSTRARALKRAAWTAASVLSVCSFLSLSPAPALAAKNTAAAAEAVTEHLHLGQKVANYFRSFGVPDLAVLALISAMPVVELRGAVPVGVWMGLDPLSQVLPVCVLGNMAPIVPLLVLLRNDRLKELMKPILTKAEKKSASIGVGSIEKQWVSLAAFVGIPLPGTGAWTGAMGAFLLGMPYAVALSSIFAGVVSAGCIMTALTMAGRAGGIGALALLGFVAGRELLSSGGDGLTDAQKDFFDLS